MLILKWKKITTHLQIINWDSIPRAKAICLKWKWCNPSRIPLWLNRNLLMCPNSRCHKLLSCRPVTVLRWTRWPKKPPQNKSSPRNQHSNNLSTCRSLRDPGRQSLAHCSSNSLRRPFPQLWTRLRSARLSLFAFLRRSLATKRTNGRC